MRRPVLQIIGVGAVVLVVILLLKFAVADQTSRSTAKADAPGTKSSGLKTPWNQPDLQGIWTDEYQTPLQRPARFAGREFLTDAERADLDERRGALIGRDRRGAARSERDVAGAYNAVFESVKPTGRRTSLVVDPPDGQIPAVSAEAQQRLGVYRTFQLALLQATVTCKNKEAPCAGGTYAPPSPRRQELSPIYNTDRLNRADGPEDRS